jgi:hypothetical protein
MSTALGAVDRFPKVVAYAHWSDMDRDFDRTSRLYYLRA